MVADGLAILVGLGSFALYMSAFFFPETYRRTDLVCSGVGMFYALALWIYGDRFQGGMLLSQAVSVGLVLWLGGQVLVLRRQKTPADQQTELPDRFRPTAPTSSASQPRQGSRSAVSPSPTAQAIAPDAPSSTQIKGTKARRKASPPPVSAPTPIPDIAPEASPTTASDHAAPLADAEPTVAATVPATVPEDLSEGMPAESSEAIAPANVPSTPPELASQPENVLENLSETIPENLPDTIAETAAETGMSEEGDRSPVSPTAHSTSTPPVISPEVTPEMIPEVIPEVIPEAIAPPLSANSRPTPPAPTPDRPQPATTAESRTPPGQTPRTNSPRPDLPRPNIVVVPRKKKGMAATAERIKGWFGGKPATAGQAKAPPVPPSQTKDEPDEWDDWDEPDRPSPQTKATPPQAGNTASAKTNSGKERSPQVLQAELISSQDEPLTSPYEEESSV